MIAKISERIKHVFMTLKTKICLFSWHKDIKKSLQVQTVFTFHLVNIDTSRSYYIKLLSHLLCWSATCFSRICQQIEIECRFESRDLMNLCNFASVRSFSFWLSYVPGTCIYICSSPVFLSNVKELDWDYSQHPLIRTPKGTKN